MTFLDLIWMLVFVGVSGVLVAQFANKYIPWVHKHFLGYGKTRNNSTIFGDVPKSWFLHFYVWAVVWDFFVLSHLLLVLAFNTNGIGFVDKMLYFLTNTSLDQLSSVPQRQMRIVVFGCLLLFVQSLRRTYESLFVAVFSERAKMHISHYLLAFVFYTLRSVTAASLLASKGDSGTKEGYSWILIGTSLFVYGSYCQYNSHVILAKLRSNKSQRNEYSIPYGGWFTYVSCPHYLAEVVLYVGVSIVLQGAWSIPIFTFLSLSVAAYNNHQWYLSKLENYKMLNRKAIIPYLY